MNLWRFNIFLTARNILHHILIHPFISKVVFPFFGLIFTSFGFNGGENMNQNVVHLYLVRRYSPQRRPVKREGCELMWKTLDRVSEGRV